MGKLGLAGTLRDRAKSQQTSESGTRFPASFVGSAIDVFGRPLTAEDIYRLAPEPRPLFGAYQPTAANQAPLSQYGAIGTQGPGPGTSAPADSRDRWAAMSPQEPYDASNQVGRYWQATETPPGTGTLTEQQRAAGTPQASSAGLPRYTPGDLGPASTKAYNYLLGQFPNGFTSQDLLGLLQRGGYGDANLVQMYQEALARDKVAGQMAGPGLPTPAEPASGFDVALGPGGASGAVNRLGFGQPGREYAPPTIGVERITTPSMQAAQTEIAGGDLARYERQLFESQYRPVQRELAREQELADRQLQAQLARAGLATSGAGVGQRRLQAREYSERQEQAATEAASRAAVQRYGIEFEQARQNTELRQQANLQNANMDLETQRQNAANVLTGNTATARAYLDTIGLNEQTAQAARTQFLALMGLQQEDLSRMDEQRLRTIELIANNWLQQFAAAAGAGRYSVGQGSSVGSGGEIGASSTLGKD